MAVRVFQTTLDSQDPIRIDRIHRSIGSKSSDPRRPKDIVCRLHHYPIKDVVIQKA